MIAVLSPRTVQCTCSTKVTDSSFCVTDLISEVFICTSYQPAVFHVTLGDAEMLCEECPMFVLTLQ